MGCPGVTIEDELLEDEDSHGDDARQLTLISSPLTPPNSPPSYPESPPKKVKTLMEIYEQAARCNFFQITEPILFQDAVEYKEWCQAMNDEIKGLERNHTGELVDLPKGKEVIGLKWIYQIKYGSDG